MAISAENPRFFICCIEARSERAHLLIYDKRAHSSWFLNSVMLKFSAWLVCF